MKLSFSAWLPGFVWSIRYVLVAVVVIGLIWYYQNRGVPVCPTTTNEAVQMFGGTQSDWIQLTPRNWLFFVPNMEGQPEISIPEGYRLLVISPEDGTATSLPVSASMRLHFNAGTTYRLIYLGCP